MMIKDLEMSKDLDRKALSTVHGGHNSIQQAGIGTASVSNVGGGLFSPTTVVNTPISVQTANLNDNDLNLDIDTKTSNVIGSLGTLIWQ